MAVGGYRLSTESFRPSAVGSGRATVGMPHGADVAGMFGTAFRTTIKAGLDWYRGVEDIGKALQGAGRVANAVSERREVEEERRNAKANDSELSEAILSY